MTIHDFGQSLKLSQSYANAPWWEPVYREAFPGFVSMHYVAKDGWAQRGGIDRNIQLDCGKNVTVDEKVRAEDWNDILLERWSDEEKRIAGWIQKALACDYIAYAFIPSGRCYLFPFLQLRRAWLLNGRIWIEQYPAVRARNNGYTTLSHPIPIDVLLRAVIDASLVTWREEPMPFAPGPGVITAQLEIRFDEKGDKK
jgi:hypothetical protein